MANGKSTSYFYAIFGITLVLIVMGIAAILVIEADRVSTDFKENLTVEIVLNDKLEADKVKEIQETIKGKAYTKLVKYLSKEEAAKILAKDLGDDFLDILGYNPLYASFLVNLKSDFANAKGFEMVKADMAKITEVKQVNFQKNILETLEKNVGTVSMLLLIIGVVLLVFAVSLIFNTVRLALFSNRLLIKSMQLFGATKWFIIQPFLGRSLVNGLLSGLIATVLLVGLLVYLDYALPELALQRDLFTFAALFGALIVFGMLISLLSTLTAMLRYLRLKVEDLY